LSLRGHADTAAFVAAFAGSHRYILDYLVEEVLAQQPAELQTFLLRTSILSRLTRPLCDAVAQTRCETWGLVDGQSLLGRLEAANLFTIALDDERRWYRYHHLFADCLRARLARAEPDLVPQLHRRAAEWYVRSALLPEAIEHALQAGEPEYAAGLMEQAALDLQARSEFTTVRRWLEALSADVLERHASLCVDYGWALLDAFEPEPAQRWLARPSDGSLPPMLRALRAALLARLSWVHGEPGQVRRFAAAALAVLSEPRLAEGVRDRNLPAVLAAFAALQLAEALRLQGELRQANQTFRDALRRVERATSDARLFVVLGAAEVGLGRTQYERNDLEAAEQHLRRGRGEPA
jgi:LuxR family maltose regulon positive regulatory protein